MDIEHTLKQRGSRYGAFSKNAEISQTLKTDVQQAMGLEKWESLPPYMQEALEMICHKLARICNGDPYYDDSWRDVAGFSMLVVHELEAMAAFDSTEGDTK